GRVFAWRYRQGGELRGHLPRRLLAKGDGLRGALEVCRADVTQVHVDAHVLRRQGLQLDALVLLHHHVVAARDQADRPGQVVACHGGLDEVDGDDHVGAGVTCDVDGQVTHHEAVRQDVLFGDHGRKGTGDRHARPHGGGNVAVIEYHHLPGEHVGRDRAV